MYRSDSEDTDNIRDEIAENMPLNSEEEDVIYQMLKQSVLSHT